MDTIDWIQLAMMFGAVAFAAKARTSQAVSVLVSTAGLCAFITGGGFQLRRAGLTWIDVLHGNGPSEVVADVVVSGAMYAGMIFVLGFCAVLAFARAETQETPPTSVHD